MCAELKLKQDQKDTEQIGHETPAKVQYHSPPTTLSTLRSILKDDKMPPVLHCACHTRYELMRAAIKDLNKRHDGKRDGYVERYDKEKLSFHQWYGTRYKKLLGITDGSPKCKSECGCHGEFKLLASEIIRQERNLLDVQKARQYGRETEAALALEASAGEIGYLKSMLRDCDGIKVAMVEAQPQMNYLNFAAAVMGLVVVRLLF